jgi:hypothetical protein
MRHVHEEFSTCTYMDMYRFSDMKLDMDKEIDMDI